MGEKGEPIRIAMWSGPRNISTALMRSWENRKDTVVIDEPLYGHYLAVSPYSPLHPGAEEIIAHSETDIQKVVNHLADDPLPDGKTIFYQKHISTHMLPTISRDWLKNVTNCFLIREPALVVHSFSKVVPDMEVEQTGFIQQMELFNKVLELTGEIPIVIDSKDVLNDPAGTLSKLCKAIGVPFDDNMLQWPAGKRDTDGIWAKYWYDSVEKSTCFATPKSEKLPVLESKYQSIVDKIQGIYDLLSKHKL